jgi:hypothetical protein
MIRALRLGMSEATRSPRRTPNSSIFAASRSLARSSSRQVCPPSAETSAISSGLVARPARRSLRRSTGSLSGGPDNGMDALLAAPLMLLTGGILVVGRSHCNRLHDETGAQIKLSGMPFHFGDGHAEGPSAISANTLRCVRSWTKYQHDGKVELDSGPRRSPTGARPLRRPACQRLSALSLASKRGEEGRSTAPQRANSIVGDWHPARHSMRPGLPVPLEGRKPDRSVTGIGECRLE